MKDETRIRNAAGRKVLADPRTHRYYLCLNDSVHIPEHTRSLSGSLLGYKTIP